MLKNRKRLKHDNATVGLVYHSVRLVSVVLLAASISAAAIAAEVPDFTGLWMPDPERSENWPAELPYTSAGRATAQTFKEKYPGNSYWPGNFCVSRPMPDLIFLRATPIEIIQTPERLTVLVEIRTPVRRIYIDGRPHPERLRRSKAGNSIGHWEGDTLVVETIGIKSLEGPRLASPMLRIVERMQMVEDDAHGKSLVDEVTIHDPDIYTEPIVMRRYFVLSPEETMLEYNCTNDLFYDYLRGLEAKRNKQ